MQPFSATQALPQAEISARHDVSRHWVSSDDDDVPEDAPAPDDSEDSPPQAEASATNKAVTMRVWGEFVRWSSMGASVIQMSMPRATSFLVIPGRVRTNPDESGRIRTNPDDSGRIRTIPDTSRRGEG
jgi:hypothetical protein